MRFPPDRLEDAAAAYEELGYCVIVGVLKPADCAVLRSLLDETQARADRGEGEAHWFADETAWESGAATRVVRKVPKPFQSDARFRAIFGRDDVLDLVEAFAGPEIYLHSSKMLYKPPRVGRPKPMHQDLAYWDEMQARQVTLWCPADRATAENGCLELLPRVHKAGLIPHEDLDDWQIAPGSLADQRPVVVEMAAGDMLFLHPLTPHASRANVSDEGRLAAVINFYSEQVRPGDGARYGSITPIRSQAAR